jgi:DnaJ family protein C protein 13
VEACGSALRILHQLCESPSVAEALATASPPAVQVLCGAMRLGPAARVLALEALKRALASVNRQRDVLVLQVRASVLSACARV